MGRFDFAAGDIVITLFLQSTDLGFCQDSTRSGNMLFQRTKTLFEVRQLVPQPDGSYA